MCSAFALIFSSVSSLCSGSPHDALHLISDNICSSVFLIWHHLDLDDNNFSWQGYIPQWKSCNLLLCSISTFLWLLLRMAKSFDRFLVVLANCRSFLLSKNVVCGSDPQVIDSCMLTSLLWSQHLNNWYWEQSWTPILLYPHFISWLSQPCHFTLSQRILSVTSLNTTFQSFSVWHLEIQDALQKVTLKDERVLTLSYICTVPCEFYTVLLLF